VQFYHRPLVRDNPPARIFFLMAGVLITDPSPIPIHRIWKSHLIWKFVIIIKDGYKFEQDKTIMELEPDKDHHRKGNEVGSKHLNKKINSKSLSSGDFTSKLVKMWEKNFEQIKNMNLNAKSMDEKDFKLFFLFKSLWTYPSFYRKIKKMKRIIHDWSLQ
jgi:hypothetical protein